MLSVAGIDGNGVSLLSAPDAMAGDLLAVIGSSSSDEYVVGTAGNGGIILHGGL